MSLRLKSFQTLMVVFAIALGSNAFAQPIFENQTPMGFSPSDSTTKTSFASDKDINILVVFATTVGTITSSSITLDGLAIALLQSPGDGRSRRGEVVAQARTVRDTLDVDFTLTTD